MDKVLYYLFSILLPKGVSIQYLLSLEDSELVKYIPRITVQQFRGILSVSMKE